jgi:hypothetical protein
VNNNLKFLYFDDGKKQETPRLGLVPRRAQAAESEPISINSARQT